MKNIITLAVAAVVAVALSHTASAVPITGSIAIAGGATLNSTSVNTATTVVSWGTNTVQSDTGALAAFAPAPSQVTLASPWNFSLGGAVANFWQVGGFTFSLASSSIITQSSGILGIFLTGTVTGNGFDATAFSGRVTFQDPQGADARFSESFSLAPVPDGGTTVLLLGTALSGLALIKRKFMA